MEKVKNYPQGKCMEMCPKSEITMREKERLLHILEMVPGTEKSNFPKVDPSRVVKCFSRSAAGKKITKEEDLRPPKVLLKTVSYLLSDVINNKKVPWHMVYDFITDRLMAVRQDMVVQNISKAENICILQPIVRFHAYAAYKLCNEKLPYFDSVLNNKHLQECMKRLLMFYDMSNNLQSNMCNEYLLQNRPEFEALYILFNLGSEEAQRRVLNIPQEYKSKVVHDAFELSVSYQHGNFVRVCRLIKKLPTLLAAVTSLHLAETRRKAFQVMATAYNSKNLNFPTNILKELLLYGTVSELLEDVKYYGIEGDPDCLYFTKQSFRTVIAVTPRYEQFMKKKFIKENLETIIFGFQDNCL